MVGLSFILSQRTSNFSSLFKFLSGKGPLILEKSYKIRHFNEYVFSSKPLSKTEPPGSVKLMTPGSLLVFIQSRVKRTMAILARWPNIEVSLYHILQGTYVHNGQLLIRVWLPIQLVNTAAQSRFWNRGLKNVPFEKLRANAVWCTAWARLP